MDTFQLRIFTEPQLGATYVDLCRVARCAEQAGFDAFFRSDHFLTMGDVSGEPGPTDAWTTLAGLARDTDTIRLGTLVTSATFRHPGPLAVTVANVDQMSGGRVEFGFGAGWYEAEHKAYGIPFPSLGERFDRFAEQLEIIIGLWQTRDGERFSFQGKHYEVVDSPALPKTAQTPKPPVIIGGGGPKRTPALAAKYADEFNLPFAPIDFAIAQYDRVAQACEAIGRDPKTMRRSVAHTVCVGKDEAQVAKRAMAIHRDPAKIRETALAGSPAEVVDLIGTWRERAGINAVYLQVLDLSDLDHIELIAAEVAPQLV